MGVEDELDTKRSEKKDVDDKIIIEIDAGVTREIDEASMEEELATLEEQLRASGKKPALLARIIKSPNVFIWILGILASISGFLFGIDQSLISGAALFMPDDLGLSDSQMSMVVGFTPLGAIFGSLTIMPVNEAFGRKWAIIIASVLFTVGAALQAAAMGFPVVLVGRIVLGVALGLCSGTVPAYVAESCAIRWRGGLVALYQCMVAFGVMCGYIVAAIFVGLPGNWRYILGSSVVFSLILNIGMLFMPESPRWLMRRGRKVDAYLVWKTARGLANLDERIEFCTMQSVITYEREMAQGRWVATDLLTKPRCRRALFIAASYQFLGQQMSGVNSIQYYQATLMTGLGLSSIKAVYTSMIGGGAMFFATIPVVLLIDRLGRRTLALTFIPGVSVGLFITGFAFLADDLPTRLGVYLVGMILFTIFWSLAVGAGPWVVASEVYPSYLRSYGISIAAVCDWVGTFLTTYPFQDMSKAMTTTGVFAGFYNGITILIGVILLLYMPETKGLSLEAISQVFQTPFSEIMKMNRKNLQVTWNDLLHGRFKQVWSSS